MGESDLSVLTGSGVHLSRPGREAPGRQPQANVVGTNGALVIRVTKSGEGVRAYRFLDVPQSNLEFARGRALGGYPIEVGNP